MDDDDWEVNIQLVHVEASALLCQTVVHHLGEAHNSPSSEVETRAVATTNLPADQQRLAGMLIQEPRDVLPREPLRVVFSMSQPLPRLPDEGDGGDGNARAHSGVDDGFEAAPANEGMRSDKRTTAQEPVAKRVRPPV